MTQTALTSQKTSGRTDQGKFTTYFTRGLAGDSRLTLDYCAELVTNAFRLTPSPEGRPGLAPRLLEGVPHTLQRPLETLLANKTHVTIKI